MHQGKEITAVYEEIMKTLSSDHLKFSTVSALPQSECTMLSFIRVPNFCQEPTLEPSLDTPVKLSNILASRTLHHRRSQRVINQNLRRSIPPPWGNETDRQVWEER